MYELVQESSQIRPAVGITTQTRTAMYTIQTGVVDVGSIDRQYIPVPLVVSGLRIRMVWNDYIEYLGRLEDYMA